MSEPIPSEGNLNLPLDFDISQLNNGEKRIVSQETGCPIQSIYLAMQNVDSVASVTEFDMADLEYGFGRIALRRRYGRDADTPENADRVVLTRTETADPTPAVS